ncbi:MAG: hypothetical protein ACKVOU_10565, partial [Cytophagales bacterium]
GSKLVEVQLISQMQKENEISIENLKKVEEEKAGYSFPFYACLIDFPPIENQFQLLYNFGIILQNIDDILDIHEDIEEKTKTVANTLKINDFEKYFNILVHDFILLLQKNKASDQTIIVSLICFGVGWVQIENLRNALSKKHFHSYSQLSRDELVCDMRKYVNLKSHLQIVSGKFKQIAYKKGFKN